MNESQAAWPTELRIAEGGGMLKIAFEHGAAFDLPAEYLRVMSPSAEVQGHSRYERKIIGGKRRVAIIGVEPIGTYAVRLSFDDMHATGIFTWTYLHELGSAYAAKWADYLAELDSNNLSRDRSGEAPSHSGAHTH